MSGRSLPLDADAAW